MWAVAVPTNSTALASATAAALGASLALPDDLTGPKLGLGIAGMVGGLISLGLTTYPNWVTRACVVAVGAGAAYYLAPMAAYHFHFHEDGGLAIGFALGVLAYPIFAGAHRLGRIWEKDPTRLLRLWRGRGKDDD